MRRISAAGDAIAAGIRRVPVIGWLWRRHWIFRVAILAGMIAAAYGIILWLGDRVERIGYDRQRIARVDAAVRDEAPTRSSTYCRQTFGLTRDYGDCWREQRHGYAQFRDAWMRGRDISTLREQLIACFATGNLAQGLSWAAAASCAEADAPPPPTVRDP